MGLKDDLLLSWLETVTVPTLYPIEIPDEPDVTDENVIKGIKEAYVQFNTDKAQCGMIIREIERKLKLMETTTVTLNSTYTSIVSGDFAKVDTTKLRPDQIEHYNKFKSDLANWRTYIYKTYPNYINTIRHQIESAIHDVRVVFDEVANRYNHVIQLQEGYNARMHTEREHIILQIKNYTDKANAYNLEVSSLQIDMNRQFEDVCEGTLHDIIVTNTEQMTVLRNKYITMNRAADMWNTGQLQHYLRLLDQLDVTFHNLSNERKRLIDAINMIITNQQERDMFINNLTLLENAMATIFPKPAVLSEDVKRYIAKAKQTLKANVNETEYIWNMQLNYEAYVDSLITPFIAENIHLVEDMEKVLKTLAIPPMGQIDMTVMGDCKHYKRYIEQVSARTLHYIAMLQDLQQDLTKHLHTQHIQKYIELFDFKLQVDRNTILCDNIVRKIIPLLSSHEPAFKIFESDIALYKNELDIIVKENEAFKLEWKTCIDNLQIYINAKLYAKLRDAYVIFKSLFASIHNMKEKVNKSVARAHWISFMDNIWDAHHRQQTQPFMHVYKTVNTILLSLTSEIKNGLNVIDQLNSYIKDMLVQQKVLSVLDEMASSLDIIKQKYNNLMQFWNQHKHEYEEAREASIRGKELTLTYSTLKRTVDNVTGRIKEIDMHIALLNQTVSSTSKLQNDTLVPLSEINDEAASIADRVMFSLETVKQQLPRMDTIVKTISEARTFLESEISTLPSTRDDSSSSAAGGRTSSVIKKAKRDGSITTEQPTTHGSVKPSPLTPTTPTHIPATHPVRPTSPSTPTTAPAEAAQAAIAQRPLTPSTPTTAPAEAAQAAIAQRPLTPSTPTIATTVQPTILPAPSSITVSPLPPRQSQQPLSDPTVSTTTMDQSETPMYPDSTTTDDRTEEDVVIEDVSDEEEDEGEAMDIQSSRVRLHQQETLVDKSSLRYALKSAFKKRKKDENTDKVNVRDTKVSRRARREEQRSRLRPQEAAYSTKKSGKKKGVVKEGAEETAQDEGDEDIAEDITTTTSKPAEMAIATQ